MPIERLTVLTALTLAVIAANPPAIAPSQAASVQEESCVIVQEVGGAADRRATLRGCERRVTPASTFKIAHALAALDAGVLDGAEAVLSYDGSPLAFPVWQRDHTLRSAMRFSVLWYFQRVAEKLGAPRERAYLEKLAYGNRDSTSGLTSFWIGGSLAISPDEQMDFLTRLYADRLPVSPAAMRTVREILVQPPNVIVNAAGEHQFAPPWPSGTVVSAKTGSARDRSGREVRWLVGHVRRGGRAWIFVSVRTGKDLAPLAAVDQAAQALRDQHVL